MSDRAPLSGDRVEPRALARGCFLRRRRAREGRRRRARRRRRHRPGALLDGRVPLRAAWALVAAAELAVGVARRRRPRRAVARGSPRRCCSAAPRWSPSGASATRRTRAAAASGRARRRRSTGGRWCAPACSRSWPRWRRPAERAGRAPSTIPSPSPVIVVVGRRARVAEPGAVGAPDAAATRLAGARRGRGACGPRPARRRVSLERSVARLRRSELWERARPYVSADAPTEHWDEGCWRLLCYPAVYERRAGDRRVRGQPRPRGRAATAVAFVDEAERRVLGRARGGRPADVSRRSTRPRGGRRARARRRPRAGRAGERAGPREAGAHRRPPPEPTSQRQPESVTFYFNEPIEASFGVIRVFNIAGRGGPGRHAVPARGPEQRARDRACSRTCPDGTYSATLPDHLRRLASGLGRHGLLDRHAEQRRRPPPLPGQAGTGSVTSTVFWANRWLGYGAIGLAVGALFFLALVVAAGARRPVGRRRRGLARGVARRSTGASGCLVGGAVVVGLLTSLLALPLQAASAAGTSLAGALHSDVLGEVVHTRFGSLMIVRTVAWALLGAILVVAALRGRMPTLRPAADGADGHVAEPPGQPGADRARDAADRVAARLAGARRTRPHAEPAGAAVPGRRRPRRGDGALARRPGDRSRPPCRRRVRELGPPQRRRVVGRTASRFSGVALVAVVALAVSGTVQARGRGRERVGALRHRLRPDRAGEGGCCSAC